jgi:hypothetical protein
MDNDVAGLTAPTNLTSFGFLLRMTSISKRLGRASQENGHLTRHKATAPGFKVIKATPTTPLPGDRCFE